MLEKLKNLWLGFEEKNPKLYIGNADAARYDADGASLRLGGRRRGIDRQ